MTSELQQPWPGEPIWRPIAEGQLKRDWELVRLILFKMEELPPRGQLDAGSIEGYDSELVARHMQIMANAGLLKGAALSSFSSIDYVALSLTWEGHELLDKIRQDTTWNKIKGILREKGIDLTVDAIKAGAALVLRQMTSS